MQKISKEIEFQLLEWDELNDQEQDILRLADDITRQSYAPYSQFHVGVVLQCADGSLYKGVNMENASFPLGSCGEASALSAYQTSGNQSPVVKVAISGKSALIKVDKPLTPCGGCRQRLNELESNQKTPCEYLCKGEYGPILKMYGIKHLLPLAFKAEDFTD